MALWVSTSTLDALAQEEDGSNLGASNFSSEVEKEKKGRKLDPREIKLSSSSLQP